MTNNLSVNQGILACPGGKGFAGEIICHLKSIYYRCFEKKVGALSDHCNLTKEELTRQLYFDQDLLYRKFEVGSGPVYAYRPPRFVVPIHFTRFAKGAIKTEIGTSIGCMDRYGIQDESNTHPVKVRGSNERRVLAKNEHIVYLVPPVDATIQASSESFTQCIPNYPYVRQHKIIETGEVNHGIHLDHPWSRTGYLSNLFARALSRIHQHLSLSSPPSQRKSIAVLVGGFRTISIVEQDPAATSS